MKPDAPKQHPAQVSDQGLKDLWDWNLDVHSVTDPAVARKVEGLRSTARAMKDAIITMIPHSRERSLALTNLEQMYFYALAALERNQLLDDTPEEDKTLAADQQNNSKEEA